MRREAVYRGQFPLPRGTAGVPGRTRTGAVRSPRYTREGPAFLPRFPLVSPMRRHVAGNERGGEGISPGDSPGVPDPVRPGAAVHPGGTGRRASAPANLPAASRARRLRGRHRPGDDLDGDSGTVPGPVPGRSGPDPPAARPGRDRGRPVGGVFSLPGRRLDERHQGEISRSPLRWKVNRLRARFERTPRASMFVTIEDPP